MIVNESLHGKWRVPKHITYYPRIFGWVITIFSERFAKKKRIKQFTTRIIKFFKNINIIAI